MDDLTLTQLIEVVTGTPVLVVMVYFLYRLDKRFAKLATQIELFMGMHADDDDTG